VLVGRSGIIKHHIMARIRKTKRFIKTGTSKALRINRNDTINRHPHIKHPFITALFHLQKDIFLS
jgi:hypothetical protein